MTTANYGLLIADHGVAMSRNEESVSPVNERLSIIFTDR